MGSLANLPTQLNAEAYETARDGYESTKHDMAFQDVLDFVRSGRRYPDEQPPHLTKRLPILYALAAGFTSANLSYSQPILNILAKDLKVSQSQIANVPALAQAGNAIGLLMILPLADFVPRRKFTLVLMGLTTILW